MVNNVSNFPISCKYRCRQIQDFHLRVTQIPSAHETAASGVSLYHNTITEGHKARGTRAPARAQVQEERATRETLYCLTKPFRATRPPQCRLSSHIRHKLFIKRTESITQHFPKLQLQTRKGLVEISIGVKILECDSRHMLRGYNHIHGIVYN